MTASLEPRTEGECPQCGHEAEAHIGGSCRYAYNSDQREQCECDWTPATTDEPRKPGTYRTDEGGIDVVVDVPESASWVEDQFPDEVAYLEEQAATEARRELLAKVEGLRATEVAVVPDNYGYLSACDDVLRLIRAGLDPQHERREKWRSVGLPNGPAHTHVITRSPVAGCERCELDFSSEENSDAV